MVIDAVLIIATYTRLNCAIAAARFEAERFYSRSLTAFELRRNAKLQLKFLRLCLAIICIYNSSRDDVHAFELWRRVTLL